MSRTNLLNVKEQNDRIFADGDYVVNGRVKNIRKGMEASVKSTVTYTPDELSQLQVSESTATTTIKVNNLSTFEAARKLAEEGYKNITCLNFASATTPGGGYVKGSRAQEEDLCRCSTLYPTLNENMSLYQHNRRKRYPIYSDHMIFSPNVTVFRDGRYNLLSLPFTVNVITSAAVNMRVARAHNVSAEDVATAMYKRIKKVLLLGLHHGSDAIVLGAFGCGVFENDPSTIADIFRRLLMEDEQIRGKYKNVTFAVLDKDMKGANYLAFDKVFGTL